jgi:hypothetical protein
MKRVRVDERPRIALLTFYNWGPRFVTRRSKSIQWFAQACAPKVSGRYHEFSLERNSCLVLNFSTGVPSVTNIVQQPLIQEKTASLTASSTPLISILPDSPAPSFRPRFGKPPSHVGTHPAPNPTLQKATLQRPRLPLPTLAADRLLEPHRRRLDRQTNSFIDFSM